MAESDGNSKPPAEKPPETPAAQPPKPAAGAEKPAAGAAARPTPRPAPAPAGPPDPPPPADLELPAFLRPVTSRLGSLAQASYWVGDWTVIVPADRLLESARALRDEPEAAFDLCSDVTAVDWPARAERFDVVYSLYSTRHRHRVRIKVRAADGQAVPSVTEVWPGANWLEREVFDMFGISFAGHPDLRRILMPDDWQGHPQRKDYPLEGPGELLIEDPLEWLELRRSADEADLP